MKKLLLTSIAALAFMATKTANAGRSSEWRCDNALLEITAIKHYKHNEKTGESTLDVTLQGMRAFFVVGGHWPNVRSWGEPDTPRWQE